MPQARFYDANGVPVQELAAAAADFFRQDNFDTTIQDQSGRTILQINKQGGVRYVFGLAYSLTVVLTPQPDGRVLVELGGETWGDKIASGAIGWVLLPPLVFTAAYGAWKQSELDDRFWAFINGYIQNRSGRYATSTVAVPYYNQGQAAPQGNWFNRLENTFGGGSDNPVPPNYQGYYQNNTYQYHPQGQPPAPYAVPAPGTAGWSTPAPGPAAPGGSAPARSSWFDTARMQPIFDQQVGRMASWQAVMADGVINYEELNHQQERVSKLQKSAENSLDTDARLKLAELLNEMGRLEGMQRTALTSSYGPPSAGTK